MFELVASLVERTQKSSGDLSFTIVVGALVGVATVLILSFLATLLLLSFVNPLATTWEWNLFENYRGIFSPSQTLRVLSNSLVFAVIATAVSFLLGLPLAWLVERTDLRRKAPVVTVMLCTLLIPSFAWAMGWLFLLHPRIGLINQLLVQGSGLSWLSFNVMSLSGMGIVMGLNLTPLAFLMAGAALRAIDHVFDEAAFVSGAPTAAIVRRILLPLTRPALVSAGIYIFMICFGTFDVPAIIGWGNRIFTFGTYLYLIANPPDGLPDYGRAAALSGVLLILAILLVAWSRYLTRDAYRYTVVTGKAYRPRPTILKRGKYLAWLLIWLYILIGIMLPICVLVWASLLPFLQPPSWNSIQLVSLDNYRDIPWVQFLGAMKNTLILAVVVPPVVLLISFAFSWVVLRTRLRGRGILDSIAFLPHGVPSVILAVGVLLFSLYVLQYVVSIYGTIWILILAFCTAWLSYGTRMTNASLIQLHRELEEVARIGGAGNWAVARVIVLPLISRSMLLAWIYLVILTTRELTLSVMLTTPGNTTLPALIWNMWLSGGLGQAAAAVICFLGSILPFMAVYSYLLHRSTKLEADDISLTVGGVAVAGTER